MYVRRKSDKVISNLSEFCGKPTQPNLSKEEMAMLHGYFNNELTDVGLLAYPYLSLEKRHTCRIVTTMTKQGGTKRNNSCVMIRNKDKLQYGLLHKLLLVSHGSEEYYLAVITNLHPQLGMLQLLMNSIHHLATTSSHSKHQGTCTHILYVL